ncbi:CoA-transferase [Bradyrhizobium sp. SBR1B]|uniref:CoA-transferase n=1 Tax=Bradyrhizobium sp. SBR1B TaxID=2663836 RepID=UPI0017CEB11F|nr:CoA-transferase [Bradyrhizobium sp. SBR1B]MBB4381088.1 glutaconate CoA-transferase subunit B [Bradyrhizobium sp. SBR1B]
MTTECTDRELLIYTISRLLEGVQHVAVGMSSPMPAAGAMLSRALNKKRGLGEVQVSILGSVKHNSFTSGSEELFDCAAQGRIGAFFLGGGQIDGKGNVNLVGAGGYPNSPVRWPGLYGSAYLYFLVPRVILFREEHSPRVLVDQVDFISAPGATEEGVYRRGGPHALLTNAAMFSFQRDTGRFRLESVHPGRSAADIREMTGFSFDNDRCEVETPGPDTETLALMRGQIRTELAEPQFAASLPDAA